MRKVPNKLLLLDFDGVIVNSIDECLLTSFNAFQQFENTGVSVDDLSNIALPYQMYFNSNSMGFKNKIFTDVGTKVNSTISNMINFVEIEKIKQTDDW